MHLLRVLGLSAVAVALVSAQPCEAPATIDAALAAAKGTDAAKAVRDQFPDSYFAHRGYQDAARTGAVFPAELQAEYRALRDAHPGDPMYQTLYARALTGTKTPEAIAVLDNVIAKHPVYPYARLKLVEIYVAPAFRDDQKLRDNIDAYRKACPSSLVPFTHVSRIEDPDYVRQNAAEMRKLMNGRTDAASLGFYGTLWTLEFKGVPLNQQEPVRERIRKDAALLRGLDPAANPGAVQQLAQAYKLLGDAEGIKWAESHAPADSHTGQSAASAEIMKWRMANPSKPNTFQENQQRLAKQADEWIAKWPDDPAPYQEKFQALRFLQDAPLEDVVKAAENWLRIYEKNPKGGGMSPYLSVAQFYSSKNMRYDQLAGLIEKGLNDNPATPAPIVSDLYPQSGMARMMANTSRWSNWNTAAGIYIKIKQYDKARELLARLGPSLQEGRPAASSAQMERMQFGNAERGYWDSMARLAQAEGRKLDGLVYERRRDSTESMMMSTMPAQMAQARDLAARATWKELGGTDEGYDAWIGMPTSNKTPAVQPKQPTEASIMQPWTTLDKPLPDFKISDANGRTWNLSDLRGKVTLINLWATWCGPCRNELPWLQKIYSKVQERKDLAVVTLNTDDNTGLILPFMNQNKYTFPVLPALDYVHKLIPELSIPRNWIVDSEGVLRSERVGFGTGDDKWVDEMIAAMEKARAPK